MFSERTTERDVTPHAPVINTLYIFTSLFIELWFDDFLIVPSFNKTERSSYYISLTFLAGLPTINALGGTSFVSRLLAPIYAFVPIVFTLPDILRVP